MCRGDSSYSNLYFLTTFYGHEIQLSFRHERLKIYCYIWLHLSWKKLSRSSRGQTGILILLSNILDYANFWWFIVIYSLSTHYLMITQLQYKDILIYLKKYCAFLSFLPLTTPTTPTMDSLSCLSSRFSSPDSSGRELIFTISADDDADDDSMVKNRETKSLTPNFGRHSHHFPRSTWNKHMARDLDARPAWATTFLSAHNTCESIHKFIN